MSGSMVMPDGSTFTWNGEGNPLYVGRLSTSRIHRILTLTSKMGDRSYFRETYGGPLLKLATANDYALLNAAVDRGGL